MAPIDDGAQGLMARQRRAAPTREHTEPIVEQPDELRQRQNPQTGRCQFEGERQVIEPPAQLGDNRPRVGVDSERWPHCRSTIDEQLDRRVGVESANREQDLTADAEWLAARGDDEQVRDLAE